MGKKSKAKVWCECDRPVFLLDAEGRPFSAEPMCQECRHPRKRRPPGHPVQETGPASWATIPADRPPELDAPAGCRGAAMAKCERVAFMDSAGAIVAGDLDAEDREPERILRRYLLERAQTSEAADPTSAEDRRLTREARQVVASAPRAARPDADAALARLRVLRASNSH
jgi:hypothetical protein